jgi:uncharacterized membrane protein
MIKYLLSAVVLVILDGLYLNLSKGYFNRQIKSIQKTDIEINFIAMAITYILLIFGLNYFIIQRNKSVQDAALLGLIVYGVFELTNLALFKNWSILTVIIDTTWGTILFALTTYIVYKIMGINKLK